MSVVAIEDGRTDETHYEELASSANGIRYDMKGC